MVIPLPSEIRMVDKNTLALIWPSSVGTQYFPPHGRARVTEGDERARLFRAQADLMPNFDDYAKATSREIPVVVLEPA